MNIIKNRKMQIGKQCVCHDKHKKLLVRDNPKTLNPNKFGASYFCKKQKVSWFGQAVQQARMA